MNKFLQSLLIILVISCSHTQKFSLHRIQITEKDDQQLVPAKTMITGEHCQNVRKGGAWNGLNRAIQNGFERNGFHDSTGIEDVQIKETTTYYILLRQSCYEVSGYPLIRK